MEKDIISENKKEELVEKECKCIDGYYREINVSPYLCFACDNNCRTCINSSINCSTCLNSRFAIVKTTMKNSAIEYN